ncbi:MAG: transcription elongation factor GreA [Armatimonadetes bacterium]|nr:transcription elongation factor GreA [Armatimonadota bacterium]
MMNEVRGEVFALTPRGYKALQAELENLTTVKRPEIAERIRESQQHGEFSEDNSELDEVKFEQAIVEGRISELKTIFSSARVIEQDEISTEFVTLGGKIEVVDLEHGDQFSVRLVSSVEADPNEDLISNESPMGQALMGKKEGEEFKFDSPDGKKRYRVVSISR